MGLVVRLVIQAKGSEEGNVTVLLHLMEVKDASDRIARKQYATLKDVQVTLCHTLLYLFIISFFSVIIEDSLAEERERAILGKTKEDEEREKEELERLKVQQKALYHH